MTLDCGAKTSMGDCEELESEPGFELSGVHEMDYLFQTVHGSAEKE